MKPEEKKKLMLLMCAASAVGIKEIRIEFSGGGDSGGIDDIFSQDPSLDSMPTKTTGQKEAKKNVEDFIAKQYDHISNGGYEVLNDTEADFNNDGSQGHIILYCETGKIVCELGINYQETRDETIDFDFNDIVED